MDLFWTPGWSEAFTLLIAPVATLVGVWLTQRSQVARYGLERSERKEDDLRAAVAALLAEFPGWTEAAAASMFSQLGERNTNSEGDRSRVDSIERRLYDATVSLNAKCVAVELLTRHQELLEPVITVRESGGRVQSGIVDAFNTDKSREERIDEFGKAVRATAELRMNAASLLAVHGQRKSGSRLSSRLRQRRLNRSSTDERPTF